MNTQVMFSSLDMTWETPVDFFCKVNEEFNFTIDVCATQISAKCDKYYTPENDGLKQKWEGVCWMNPPYGRPNSVLIMGYWKVCQQFSVV